MDVYVPASAALDDGKEAAAESTHDEVATAGRPVALFCHGGVWASGKHLD